MNGAQPIFATSSSWLSWPHGRRLIIAVAAVVCVSLVLAMRNSQVHLRPFPTVCSPPPFQQPLSVPRSPAWTRAVRLLAGLGHCAACEYPPLVP